MLAVSVRICSKVFLSAYAQRYILASNSEHVPVDVCAKGRLKSVCASEQFEQSSAWRNCILGCSIELCECAIQNVPSEGSDPLGTARMRRLIWIFARRSCPTVRFLTLPLICLMRTFVKSLSVYKRLSALESQKEVTGIVSSINIALYQHAMSSLIKQTANFKELNASSLIIWGDAFFRFSFLQCYI